MALLNPASWQRWKQIMNHRYLRIQRCCWWERCCSPASSDRHPCGLARHALHSHALHHTMLPLHAPHHTTPPSTSQHPPTVFFTNAFVRSVIFFSIPCNAPPQPPARIPRHCIFQLYSHKCVFSMPCPLTPSHLLASPLPYNQGKPRTLDDASDDDEWCAGEQRRVLRPSGLGTWLGRAKVVFFLNIFFESFFSF